MNPWQIVAGLALIWVAVAWLVLALCVAARRGDQMIAEHAEGGDWS